MSALLIRAKMVVCATQKKANLLFANVQVATLVITVSNVKMAVHQIHARTMEHVSQGKADLSCANVQLILKAYSARKQVVCLTLKQPVRLLLTGWDLRRMKISF